jgi:hypothetical protein
MYASKKSGIAQVWNLQMSLIVILILQGMKSKNI